MIGMMRNNQVRRQEMACTLYERMNGIQARKRFQIKPICRPESVYATRAATSAIHTAQAMLSNTKTAILCRFRMTKSRSPLSIECNHVTLRARLSRPKRFAYRRQHEPEKVSRKKVVSPTRHEADTSPASTGNVADCSNRGQPPQHHVPDSLEIRRVRGTPGLTFSATASSDHQQRHRLRYFPAVWGAPQNVSDRSGRRGSGVIGGDNLAARRDTEAALFSVSQTVV